MTPVSPCTETLAEVPARPRVQLARASATAVAVLGSAILPVVLVPTLAAEIGDDIRLGSERLGTAIAAFWAAAALGAAPAGRLIDRIGGAAGVHAAGLLSAAGSLGIALGPRGYGTLVAGLVACGLASALAAPGISALVSRQMAPERRGTVLGFQQSGPPAATLLAAAALPLLAGPIGWPLCFALAAVIALAATASVPRRECQAARAHPAADATGVLPLALSGGLAAAAASAGVTFLVPFARDEGLSSAEAGLILGGASVLAITTRVGLGVRADRGGRDRLLPVGILLFGGTAGFALLATGGTAATVVGSLLGLGAGWGWSGLLVLAAIERRPEAPGAAVGATVSGFFTGAVLGPLVAGPLAGVSTAAVWAGCAAACAAAALVLLAERHRLGALATSRPAPAP